MHLMFTILLCLTMGAVLAGCATKRMDTPSGQPEVVLNNVPAAKVKERLAQVYLKFGFIVEKDSQFQIVFIRPDKRGGLFAPIELRTTFSIVEDGPTTKVIAESALVTAAGHHQEDVNTLTLTSTLNDLQNRLNELRQHFGQGGGSGSR